MTRITVLCLLCLCLVIAIAGCGGGTKEPVSEPDSPTEQPAPAAAPAPAGNAGKYGKYLTVADVEEATGLQGLSVKEELYKLVFSDSEGRVILEAHFRDEQFYEDEVIENQKYYTDVPGVGDKAAVCIPDMPYRLTFLKGKDCVMVQTLQQDGKLPVSEDQLIAIAGMIASRL